MQQVLNQMIDLKENSDQVENKIYNYLQLILN